MSPNDLVHFGEPSTVLLVEDNAMIALDIEDILLSHGVSTVILANSLAEANTFQNQDVSLAILDFNLGNETTETLARALTSKDVPVIFVSGFAERLSMPADLMDLPIVVKPFTPEDLLTAIQTVRSTL